MNTIKFRMLHISGEWHVFSVKIETGITEEQLMQCYADSLDRKWFNVGQNIFKGSDWSCLTCNGIYGYD